MPDVLSASSSLFFIAPLALLVFFLVWEGPEGRFRFESPAERWRHIGVNLSLLLIATALRSPDLAGLARGTMPAVVAEWMTVGWSTPLLAGVLPVWAIVCVQLLVALIAVDLLEYWRHRLHHRLPWLWRLHRVHHSDPLLDATSAGRIHPVESLVATLLIVVVLVLAGVPIWIEVLRASLVNPVVFAQHANVRFNAAFERVAGRWLASPEWHRVHHSRDMADQNSNYGQLLNVWDKLFGTGRPAPAGGVATMGVEGLDDRRTQSLAGLLLLPGRGIR